MRYCERIVHHYEQVWSNCAKQCHWQRGPIRDLPDGFCVLEFPPTQQRSAWTYATSCMSQAKDNICVEIFLLAPLQSDRHVELLTAVSHFHRTGSQIRLGDSVNFGSPWIPGSSCSYGLISLPYLDGPTLEVLELPEFGTSVHCLWLVPITAQEVAYKKQYGVEALESKFDEQQLNYVDPTRQSVV